MFLYIDAQDDAAHGRYRRAYLRLKKAYALVASGMPSLDATIDFNILTAQILGMMCDWFGALEAAEIARDQANRDGRVRARERAYYQAYCSAMCDYFRARLDSTPYPASPVDYPAVLQGTRYLRIKYPLTRDGLFIAP